MKKKKKAWMFNHIEKYPSSIPSPKPRGGGGGVLGTYLNTYIRIPPFPPTPLYKFPTFQKNPRPPTHRNVLFQFLHVSPTSLFPTPPPLQKGDLGTATHRNGAVGTRTAGWDGGKNIYIGISVCVPGGWGGVSIPPFFHLSPLLTPLNSISVSPLQIPGPTTPIPIPFLRAFRHQ